MAKKRINIPFVVVTLLVLCLLGGAGVMVWRYRQKDPARVVKMAEQLYAAGKFTDAASHYAGAAQLKKDSALFAKAGDIMMETVMADDRHFGMGLAYYSEAVRLDPGYVAGHEKLLEIYRDYIGRSGRRTTQAQKNEQITVFDRIDETCAAILRARPDHPVARLAQHANVIERWLSGATVDAEKVAASIKAIEELQKEMPEDVDIPYTLARIRLYEGQQLITREDRSLLQAKFDEAEKIMLDAIAAKPQSARLNYRAALIYSALGNAAPDRAAAVNRYQQPLRDQAALIVKNANTTDTDYADYMFMASQIARNEPDIKKSEQILTDALKVRDWDLNLRMALAESISFDPSRRADAIALLKNVPAAPKDQTSGVKGQRQRTLELLAATALINMQLDQYVLLTDKAEKDALMKEINTAFEPLLSKYGDAPVALRLRGKLELVKEDNIAALQTLSKALERTDPDDPTRFETTFLLARANLATKQTAKAKQLLTGIVEQFKDHVPSLRLLAQTYIEERDFASAKPHIQKLIELVPDNPDIVRLTMLTLDPKTQQEQIKATIDRLPTDTRKNKVTKAQIAAAYRYYEDARVALESVLAETPGDAEAAILLSQYWSQYKQDKTKAMEVLDAAQKANPESQQLVVAKETLGGAEASTVVKSELDKMPDGPEKHRALIAFYVNIGDEAKMFAEMQALEKLTPDDPKLWEKFFTYYVTKREFDKANPYLAKLVAGNVDRAGGKLYRWNLAMAKGDLNEARTFAGDLTREAPEFAQSWVSLAQTVERQGMAQTDPTEANAKFEEAIPYYTQALDRQANNVQAYGGIINCFYRLNRYTEARKYLEQAVRTTGNENFRRLLAEHEVRYGNPETVIAEREQYLKESPEDPAAYVRLFEAYRATAAAKSDKEDVARQYLTKAHDVMATAVDKFPANARFLAIYSDLALSLNRFADAEKRWLAYAAGAGKEDHVGTALGVSGFYRRAGKFPEADKVLRDEQARAGGTTHPAVQIALASLLKEQGKQDDAIAALKGNDENIDILRMRIELLMEAQKYEEAEKTIDAALAQQGAAGAARLPLLTAKSAIYLGTNRTADGQKILAEVLAIDPNFTPALIQRGLAAGNEGRTGDAIADLTKVRELLSGAQDPGSISRLVQARQLLADALLKSNEVDRAINELEGVLTLDPTQKGVRMRLLSLYINNEPKRFTDAERLVRDAKDVPALANDPQWLASEAMLWSQRGDHGRAFQKINEAIKLQPGNTMLTMQMHEIMLNARQYQQLQQLIDRQPDAYKQQWWVIRDRATASYLAGDKQGGMNGFNAAIAKCDAEKNFDALQGVLQTVARYAGAEQAVKLLGDRVNSNPRLKLMAASLYLSAGNMEQARKASDELIAMGDQVEAQQRVSALQVNSTAWMIGAGKDFSKAKSALVALTKLLPEDFAIWNNLACIETNSPAETLEYSKKAYELMQRSRRAEPLVLDTYGAALVANGQNESGINILLEAYRALRFKDAALHLAEGYLALGNLDEAEKYLKDAQEILNLEIEQKKTADAVSFQEKIADAQRKLNEKRLMK